MGWNWYGTMFFLDFIIKEGYFFKKQIDLQTTDTENKDKNYILICMEGYKY